MTRLNERCRNWKTIFAMPQAVNDRSLYYGYVESSSDKTSRTYTTTVLEIEYHRNHRGYRKILSFIRPVSLIATQYPTRHRLEPLPRLGLAVPK